MRIAINGFGRIGRMTFKAGLEKGIRIVAINDLTDTKTLANLLKYDSVHGKFNADVKFNNNSLIINKKKISFSQESDINNIKWKKFGVEYVFECTGKFNSKEKLISYLLKKLIKYFSEYFFTYKDLFQDVKTYSDYVKYVRNVEQKTLSGD